MIEEEDLVDESANNYDDDDDPAFPSGLACPRL